MSWIPPLSRRDIDLCAPMRGREGLIEDLIASPGTRVLLMDPSHPGSPLLVHDNELVFARIAVSHSGDEQGDAGLTITGSSLTAGIPEGQVVFLGKDEDCYYLGASVDPDGDIIESVNQQLTAFEPATSIWQDYTGQGYGMVTLRTVGHLFSDRDAGLATTASALLGWHRLTGFCSFCGESTVAAQGGWVRRCDKCEYEIYPRIDNVVIVTIFDDQDRLLLANNRYWSKTAVSLISGFVEAGESMEQAVKREVKEEVNLEVEDIRYIASQSWPFPASLMNAFSAKVKAQGISQLHPDGSEIQWAQFFTREEVIQGVKKGEIILPVGASIARALTERWLGEKLS